MSEKVAKGTWVEISSIVLEVGERSPHVPEDTQKVPLELKTKGFLIKEACADGRAEIETVAGRRLVGTLTAVNPAYTHGFGSPVTQLTPIGNEVRALLRGRGRYR